MTLETVRDKLVGLTIGSCSCGMKMTHDYAQHEEHCTYRVASEALRELDALQSPLPAQNDDALIGRVMEWPDDWTANVEPSDIAARCRTLVQEARALAPLPALAGEREALAGLEVLYLREGESWNECFERVGELFHKDTGYLRPGKDYGALSGFSDEQGRSEAWDKWIAGKVTAARAALASRPTTQAPEPVNNDGAGIRFQAEMNGPFMAAKDLARRIAFAGRDKHDYLPQTIEAAKTWTPHDWVIRAMRDYAEAMVLQTPAVVTQAPAEPAAIQALKAIIKCDDDAIRSNGNPGANLNGYGLVDLFDCVGHPFGAGGHKQQPYRSNELDAALEDARRALAPPTPVEVPGDSSFVHTTESAGQFPDAADVDHAKGSGR